MLTEWQIVDRSNSEWYSTVINEQDVPYVLALHKRLHPSVDFEVREKTYGNAA